MPVIALCTKGIQDSLGFWIPLCGKLATVEYRA